MNYTKLEQLIEEIEKKIKYVFKDKSLLILSVTHSSYANENKAEKLESNERLEFLGDTVLDIVVSEYLYFKYPKLPEGELTKMRAGIVCEPTISDCAKALGFGDCILLGKGEEMTGGRQKISILSDMFEAVTGAIYLDGGLESAKGFLLRELRKYIDNVEENNPFIDYKTRLQELMQKEGEVRITYDIISETGPEHNKIFEVQARVGEDIIGRGKGHNKKEAEQAAASDAIKFINKH